MLAAKHFGAQTHSGINIRLEIFLLLFESVCVLSCLVLSFAFLPLPSCFTLSHPLSTLICPSSCACPLLSVLSCLSCLSLSVLTLSLYFLTFKYHSIHIHRSNILKDLLEDWDISEDRTNVIMRDGGSSMVLGCNIG